MAVFFGMPDDDAKALLARAMREWHPALHKLGVRVQIIMAASDTDAPAVKHGGYAALATVRIVSLKDRLTKQYDAEMLVSRIDFEQLTEGGKLALFDHELSHIDTVKKEVKQRRGYKGPKKYTVPLDDLGRPKLKLRLGDWSAGDGFAAVVRRHGDAAVEFENLRRAYDLAERAKNGEWAPEPSADADDIEGTEDRDGVGRQLPFLDPDAGLADVVTEAVAGIAGLEDVTVSVTYHPAVPPAAVEVVAPAAETPANQPAEVPETAPVEVGSEKPSWRATTLDATGWESSLDPEVWAALKVVPTAGELADRLLGGERFGLLLIDLESVYALVEQISEDDEAPIDFDAHFNPPQEEREEEAEEEAAGPVSMFEVGAEPAPICSLQLERALHAASKGEAKPATKLADLDNFPDAVADLLAPAAITTVETLLESMEGKAYLGPEMPLRNRLVAFLVASDSDIKIRQAEHAAQAVAEFVEPVAKPVKVVDVLNLPKPKRVRKGKVAK